MEGLLGSTLAAYRAAAFGFYVCYVCVSVCVCVCMCVCACVRVCVCVSMYGLE